MNEMEKHPQKGKPVGHLSDIVVKEIKYEKFRFYFITNSYILKFGTEDELATLLIKFVKMSEKKNQQRTINDIKRILNTLGFEAF